jgi:hypothetical protein
MGWGDAPGATAHELVSSLARFDPQGLSRALGRDEDHSQWFADVCEALLPNYTYSLGWDVRDGAVPDHLPVIPLRSHVAPYSGPALPWPPGWSKLWRHLPHTNHASRLIRTSLVDVPSDADR